MHTTATRPPVETVTVGGLIEPCMGGCGLFFGLDMLRDAMYRHICRIVQRWKQLSRVRELVTLRVESE